MSEETWATRTVIADSGEVRQTVRRVAFQMTTPRHTRHLELSGRLFRAGSQPENDIVIHDDTVSRLHFEIVAEEKGFRVRDLGSRNGTRVDGMRVVDAYLRTGAVIEVGRSRAVFQPTETEDELTLWPGTSFGGLVGRSPRMRELFSILDRAAKSDITVLVEGESGTGKELVSRALHTIGERRQGPLVVADCGAMPSNLLDSVLFGHERGAFTGADTRRVGLFEEAEGGTLFLDEIGELPLELQPKLLRVLERREVRPIGASAAKTVDVRVVAATNRDLAQEVNRGAFREDLYYRLAVVRLQVPPLRDRPEDIRPLVEHLIASASPDDPTLAARTLGAIKAGDWERLEAHPWPGNVRELKNVIQRSIALKLEGFAPDSSSGSPLQRAEGTNHQQGEELNLDRPYGDLKAEVIARFDQAYLLRQLDRHDGNISRAARASGLERMHFKRLLKKLDP